MVHRKTFCTANGDTKATKGLRLGWEAPNCQIIPAMPCILKSTPSVLSMGQRCMRDGSTFIWLAGHHPCLITKDGDLLPLDIDDDIPYVQSDSLWKQNANDTYAIKKLCGIMVKDK